MVFDKQKKLPESSVTAMSYARRREGESWQLCVSFFSEALKRAYINRVS